MNEFSTIRIRAGRAPQTRTIQMPNRAPTMPVIVAMWRDPLAISTPSSRIGSVTKTRKGLGCLVLFALPFAGAGLFVGFLALKMLWLWVDVRDWYQVPTEILEVHLTVSDGEDGDTYKVEARYRYEFDGQIYEGDRVGLSFGSDNIGSYHQDKYDELRGYRSRDETFWCYVDPEAPTDSILYREMRWGLFALLLALSLIFAGAGIGLIVGGIWAVGRVEKDEQRSALNPDRPWLWKEEWAEGRIEATGKAQFVLPCIMAIFWNLISTPLLFLLPEEILEKKNHLAALGLVFPLVGVGLLIWAGRSMIRWRKFGDSVFEMSTFPGVIGGPLTGRILTSVDLEPADGFHIGLSSINKVTSGSGDSRSTSERILWQDERHILHEAAAYDPTRSEIRQGSGRRPDLIPCPSPHVCPPLPSLFVSRRLTTHRRQRHHGSMPLTLITH